MHWVSLHVIGDPPPCSYKNEIEIKKNRQSAHRRSPFEIRRTVIKLNQSSAAPDNSVLIFMGSYCQRTSEKTTVHTVEVNEKLRKINEVPFVRERIRTAVKAIGEDVLGVNAKEVGTTPFVRHTRHYSLSEKSTRLFPDRKLVDKQMLSDRLRGGLRNSYFRHL